MSNIKQIAKIMLKTFADDSLLMLGLLGSFFIGSLLIVVDITAL